MQNTSLHKKHIENSAKTQTYKKLIQFHKNTQKTVLRLSLSLKIKQCAGEKKLLVQAIIKPTLTMKSWMV
jgi:hypothetical protein